MKKMMKVYFYSNQCAVCGKIMDCLSPYDYDLQLFNNFDSLHHLLNSKKEELPDIAIIDYTFLQHSIFNPFRFLASQNRDFPLVFYNDPYPKDGQRVTYWSLQIATNYGYDASDEVIELLTILMHLIESPEIRPYISVIQPPKELFPTVTAEMNKEEQTNNYNVTKTKLPAEIDIFKIKKQTNMSPAVFKLFQLLTNHYNSFIPEKEILQNLLIQDRVATKTTLAVYISKLKNYLRSIPDMEFEILHSRKGYKLEIF